jgi:hypothetical protein
MNMSKKQLPAGAEFSECGRYRYQLWRIWDESLPKVMCIGLNPSKASTVKNDNTITILSIILKKLGYGGFYMMNMFAWISSNPKDLLSCYDPIGDNTVRLQDVATGCQEVIFCWGNFKQAEARINHVVPMFPAAKCFGHNKNGTPFHPRAMSYKGLLKSPELIQYKQ